MINPTAVIGVVLALAATLIVVLAFNRLVTFRQATETSYANVDTELQRRHDLIGNLVTVVQAGADHERQVLESVAAARSSAAGPERDRHEADLVAEGRQLLALAEAYPVLQASAGFRTLSAELTRTEDRIAAARRLHNNNVLSYNRRVTTFPMLVLARIARFRSAPYLAFDRVIDQVPPVALRQTALQ
jgi:LemA protein